MRNTRNFKALENGVSSVNGQYEIAVDFFTGAQTYNQNK